MKHKLLPLLKLLLWGVARAVLKRYKPHIIGVTGSVGKTSTKNAIYTVLKYGTDKRVRVAGGNLNNEVGLPLAVLGDYKESGGMSFWIRVFFGVIWKFISFIFPWSGKKYPEILILEYGADKPGDIAQLIQIAKPDVAVITAVGEIPVHVEFYEDANQVAKEKARLVKHLDSSGVAILNADEETVLNIGKNTDAAVRTFGFSAGADIRVSDFRNVGGDENYGISMKLKTGKESTQIFIKNILGKSHGYAVSAAAAVGLVEGISLNTISEALDKYKGENGRTKLIRGVKGSLIIDDTYNSSPSSSDAALEILGDIDAPRKVAVLGDMLELGIYTEKAHRNLGKSVANVADVLVTVGSRAEFIAEGARDVKFPEEQIHSFGTSDEAKVKVQNLVKEGDLIIVKASQGIRAEKIVLEIMEEPQRARELLVRQYGKWLES